MTSSSQDNRSPQKWAVLIGINCYIPGNTRHPVYVKPLSGCVNDVEVAENYLVKHQHIEGQRIHKLIASFSSTNGSSLPAESPENWPTYENMKEVFERVTMEANPDDIIYIHYSGHGGRVATIGPKNKNGDSSLRIDEALVPVDFNTGGRYFMDIELACVLKRMADKGLHVTVVLDTCHSGGMGRNAVEESPRSKIRPIQGDSAYSKSSVRSIQGVNADGIDWTRLKTDISDFPEHELAHIAQFHIGKRPSNSTTERSPQGWVIVAACQPHEVTGERLLAVDGLEPKTIGYLTYGWYNSLLNAPANISYDALFRRTQDMMRQIGVSNSPVIMGNIRRQMFLNTATEVTHTIPISSLGDRRALLWSGRAHGVCEGDIYKIYSWDTSHIGLSSPHLATAEVKVLRPTEAEADLQMKVGEQVPAVGCHAILLHRNLPRVTLHLVAMLAPDATETQKSKIEQLKAYDLSKVELTAKIVIGSTRQNPERDNNRIFHFDVIVNCDGHYMLLESGNGPEMLLPASSSLELLFELINHIGLYYHYQTLQCPNPNPNIFDFQPPPIQPDKYWNYSYGQRIKISDGSSFDLAFKNRTHDFLYISVFRFSSSWGISRVYPPPELGDYEEVDWGHERRLSITLPFPTSASGQRYVVETIKIFVTTRPTSFQVMEGLSDVDSTSEVKESFLGEDSYQQLHNTLQTFDSPHTQLDDIEELLNRPPFVTVGNDLDSTAFRPPLKKHEMATIKISSGTREIWQTKDITVHIYPN
ncbi:caspase domain-containing protein [Trichoderma camerunense]